MRLAGDQVLYVRSLGKLVKVTAIFHDEAEANQYLSNHRDEGVIAHYPPYVLVANVNDDGVRVG